MDTQNDNGNKQLEDQNPDNNASPILTNQKNKEEKQDLQAEPKVSNIDMGDSKASEPLHINDQDKDNGNIETKNSDTLSFVQKSIRERREDSKKDIRIFREITLNEGGNLMEKSMPHIPLSFPTTPLQLIESNEDENWKFLRDARSPRSGSPVSSPGSPTPSVYHDAVGDRDEYWKRTGGSVVGAGLGINFGQSHDESTKRYQHDMLVRSQESNVKPQKELEECHKKIMVTERQAVENRRKSMEWQLSKEQYYEEEIQRIKDEHISELSAQKEALQKAIKLEIGLEKAQLVQESSSRISQEVTKACKKQELRIKQLNRIVRDLRGEKLAQEMDMEAYREKIAGQGEELVNANKKVQELVHNLAGRNQEIESLHAKIGGLEKSSIEAQSLAEQTVKELQKSKRELEARQTKEDYTEYLISDAETRSESESSVSHWNSGRRTAEPKNWELELATLSEKVAKGKAVIENQSCQINQLKEVIADLAKAREEADATIKLQKRKIQSLEGLKQRLIALSESFDNLNEQFNNLSSAEEQGRATIKQLRNEIGKFVATRTELKAAHECLIAKETDLSETMVKLQQHEAVIKPQKKENDEPMITKTKFEEVQADIDAKETELNESMNKLESKDSIINQQQKEINELMITKTKLEEVQDSLGAKETELNESMNKLERKDSIIIQQQKEIGKLLIAGIKLKEVQECLDAKQIDSDEAIIKLERNESILKQQQKEINKLLITGIKLIQVQESLNSMQAKLDETMIKQEQDEAIIKQQRKKIDELLLIRAKFNEEQEYLDSKQTELNGTMIRLERDKAMIKQQQQGEIQELEITRASWKKLQGSLNAKHTHLDKTMIELEQANKELQVLRDREQQQEVQADAKLEEAFEYNQQARPVLVDHSVKSNRKNASTSTRSSYADKQNPLPNVGESARALANLINNNNNSSSTTRPPRETSLFGAAGDISDDNIEDDGYYYDDGHKSLQDILQMAVAGGAAILRKLEITPTIGL